MREPAMTRDELLSRLERMEQTIHNAMEAVGLNHALALDALALSEARAALQGPSAREAFEAGFNACQDSTDRYGEYHGESLDVEFENWLAALPTEEN